MSEISGGTHSGLEALTNEQQLEAALNEQRTWLKFFEDNKMPLTVALHTLFLGKVGQDTIHDMTKFARLVDPGDFRFSGALKQHIRDLADARNWEPGSYEIQGSPKTSFKVEDAQFQVNYLNFARDVNFAFPMSSVGDENFAIGNARFYYTKATLSINEDCRTATFSAPDLQLRDVYSFHQNIRRDNHPQTSNLQASAQLLHDKHNYGYPSWKMDIPKNNITATRPTWQDELRKFWRTQIIFF